VASSGGSAASATDVLAVVSSGGSAGERDGGSAGERDGDDLRGMLVEIEPEAGGDERGSFGLIYIRGAELCRPLAPASAR